MRSSRSESSIGGDQCNPIPQVDHAPLPMSIPKLIGVLASLLEAVRDRTKVVDLKQVNRVLMQPHWRRERDIEK
jgi:hypothetical protein